MTSHQHPLPLPSQNPCDTNGQGPPLSNAPVNTCKSEILIRGGGCKSLTSISTTFLPTPLSKSLRKASLENKDPYPALPCQWPPSVELIYCKNQGKQHCQGPLKPSSYLFLWSEGVLPVQWQESNLGDAYTLDHMPQIQCYFAGSMWRSWRTRVCYILCYYIWQISDWNLLLVHKIFI